MTQQVAAYEVPVSHPRYQSLMTRERIVAGVAAGVTSTHGLIAQGRGEAFDYLIGEATHDFALAAIDACLLCLLQAKRPVFSINGNVAALVPDEMVSLAKMLGAQLEVNIFHASQEREQAIASHLRKAGAEEVLLPDAACQLPGMEHNRRFVHPSGIAAADVVFVPLEDGDRCEALVKSGKTVITVDLNPASRTARTAQITIVDNVLRVVRAMAERLPAIQSLAQPDRRALIEGYDNDQQLVAARKKIISIFGAKEV